MEVKMSEVHNSIIDRLKALGYTVSLASSTSMMAAMGDHNKMQWKIISAGLKAFEVTVHSQRKEDFTGFTFLVNGTVSTVECHYNESSKDWFSFARFRRDNDGIKNFIDWLGGVLHQNKHLREALYDSALPAPLGFSDRSYDIVNGYVQAGLIWRARVTGISAITQTGSDGDNQSNYMLTDVAQTGEHPWFVVELQTASGNVCILTDSDQWYVVVVLKSGQKKIMMSHEITGVLRLMNRRDQDLLKHAISLFVADLERVA